MQLEKQLRAYYKQALYKGKSVIGRVFDFLMLRVVILAAFYIWFSLNVHNQLLSIVLSIIALGMFCAAAEVYKGMKFDKFMAHHNRQLKHKYMLEQLALMPKREFVKAVCEAARRIDGVSFHEDTGILFEGEPLLIYPLQGIDPVTKQQVLSAYKHAQEKDKLHVFLFSASDFSLEADSLAHRLRGVSIKLIAPKELIAMGAVDSLIDDDTLTTLIAKELEARREKRMQLRKQPFLPGKAKGYLIAAGILIIATFITGYTIYYPMLASVCVSLAILSWWFSRKSEKPHDTGESL